MLEDSIDDGLGEVIVVQDGPPALRVLVGGEDHGAAADVSVVDDVVEHVGGIVAVAKVTDLVDHQDVRLDVAPERVAHGAVTTGGGQVVDELRRGREERIEAVLHRAVRDGDGEVRLAAARLALEDDRMTFGDEVRGEQRADGREAQARLVGEVELLDGAQEGKAGGADGASEPRAAAMRDLLREEREEQRVVRPVFLLGALDEVAPGAARVGEVQALEQRVEVGAHEAPPFEPARPKGKPSW